MSDIDLGMVVALPIEGGFTWSLASRLGHMLRIAEERYGERDRSYTPLGVEFSPNGPQIWYPGNDGGVVIQLGLACLDDPGRAHYQLAHECVHLLSPSGSLSGTVLEEGLATRFSQDYVREHLGLDWGPSDPRYVEARDLVGVLLDADVNSVKKLREKQRAISSVRAEDIRAAYPDLGNELAVALTRRFPYDER
jgi:hypothetical protein